MHIGSLTILSGLDVLFIFEVEPLESLSKFNDWFSLGDTITESFVVVMERWVVSVLS